MPTFNPGQPHSYTAPMMSQISVSDILPYMACPERGALRNISQHWVAPSRAMRRGTMLHKYVEQILRTGTPNHEYLNTLPGEFRDELAPLIDAADKYLLPFPYPLMGIEMSFGMDISTRHSHTELVGRLDSVPECDGGLWSGQVKTFGKGQDLGRFLEKVRLSPHEVIYRTALRKLFPDRRIKGTILYVFRTYLTKAQKEANVPTVEIFHLLADTAQDDRIAGSIIQSARALVAARTGLTVQPRNLNECFGPWGSCPLIPVCYEGADVTDCLTVPLENRYEDLPPRPSVLSDPSQRRVRRGGEPTLPLDGAVLAS